MFGKHAFQSPSLCTASQQPLAAALPGSGAVVDNQPFHKVTMSLGRAHNCISRMLMVRRQLLIARAVDKDSQPKYDYDQDKALQSLNELDQQLDSLLKKPAPQPKAKASNPTDTLRDQMKEEEDVFSGPSLAYGALVVFAFTIFYNIFFLTVIKPSIDIPDEVDEPVSLIRTSTMQRNLTPQMLVKP